MKTNSENNDFGKLIGESLSALFGDLLTLSAKEIKKNSPEQKTKAGNTNIYIRITVNPPKRSWWERIKEYWRAKFKKLRRA